MAEKDADTKTSLKDTSFKLTDGISRVLRAGSEAATEATVGAVKVSANAVTGLAQSIADNFNAAVVDGTETLQRSVDKFFSGLDSGSEAAEPAGAAGTAGTTSAPKSEPKKSN